MEVVLINLVCSGCLIAIKKHSMVSLAAFRKMALAFPEVEELPHFHLASFRWKKKIFTTLWEKENRAMLKLPLSDQSVYCDYDPGIFSPVPGSWGKQGATFVDLKKVSSTILQEALSISYQNIVQKRRE